MSLRDNPLGELKVPLTWTAGIVFLVVLIASVAILLTDRREGFDTDAYGHPRTLSDKVMAPVGEVISAPGRWTGAGIDSVRGYFFAVSENRRLKAELKDMQQWRDVAIALKDNNERYQALLGLKTDPPIDMATARIVTDSRGPFANTRLADAGWEKGIRPGNPVMSENGLVGRIVGVTNGASRVLMLTDVASRTPVMIDRTNARAILTGDGGPNPQLAYLRGLDPVKSGDRVLTSGDGGVFPRGLPVGVAVKGLDGRWRVVLASDRAPVDYVRILLFQDFTQIVNRAGLDKVAVPPPTPGASTLPPPEPAAPAAAAAAKPDAKAAAPAADDKAAPTKTPATSAATAKKPADKKTTDKTTADKKPVDKAAADKKQADKTAAPKKPADGGPAPAKKPLDGKAPAKKPTDGAPAGKASEEAKKPGAAKKPAVAKKPAAKAPEPANG
jgi:rod shape-determining protein MreC